MGSLFLSILATGRIESSGLPVAIICAFIGLAFALYLIKSIIGASAGNEKMQQIASAIEEATGRSRPRG